MKKFFMKQIPIIVNLIILSICYYIVIVKPDFGPNDMIIRKTVMVAFGTVCLGSGLLGWKCFGIRFSLRKTKYGEILNTIFMTFIGIALILLSFTEL